MGPTGDHCGLVSGDPADELAGKKGERDAKTMAKFMIMDECRSSYSSGGERPEPSMGRAHSQVHPPRLSTVNPHGRDS